MNLAQRVVELHIRLVRAGIPYAFGGAIALAYWTEEPRGTRDIDLNVFVPAAECERALAALPEEVEWDGTSVAAIARDGQLRLWWDNTPLDLFFSYEPLHEEAARHRRRVPFEGEEIAILGPVELAVFKAMFDRTRDWADIEEMLASEALDADAVRDHLVDRLGPRDERVERLEVAVSRASAR